MSNENLVAEIYEFDTKKDADQYVKRNLYDVKSETHNGVTVWALEEEPYDTIAVFKEGRLTVYYNGYTPY